MKIGFDAKRAMQNYTGLGNYSRYIVDKLCFFYPHNQYILYAPKNKQNQQLKQLLDKYNQLIIRYPIQSIWKKLSSLWRIWGITTQLKHDEIQIYHGLSNELPLNIKNSGIKTVVTIHDLIFLHFPQYYKFIDRKIYTYKFHKACLNADKIIAISECTKKDIMQFFNIPNNKIEVIYQGCSELFQKEASRDKKKKVKDKYNLPQQYILNVGSIEERKNALFVVNAMINLPKEIHLVIVGKHTPYTKKIDSFIQTHNLEDRIHILNNIPFEDLPAIYQQAEIFVYPSRYEGFGIPIIEALYSGIPVIGATGSCLEEAGGPDSVYVDPDNINELVNSLKEILSNPKKKEKMILSGKEYAKHFSKEEQIKSLINIYRTLIN